ncbi:MAG: DUF2029 domain-containing protein [Proteobacteria bacterium]|nr:DUF2029 domain-containing protein [Pseudomonadota bacterium]
MIKNRLFLFLILFIYSLLFYFIFNYQYKLDFSSLYSACEALKNGINPYQVLTTSYLPEVKKLPANLNPPFVLWFFSLFIKLSYLKAVFLWLILSIALSIIAARTLFILAFTKDSYLEIWREFYFFYFALFSTLINIAILQLGFLLFFLIMLGYSALLKERDGVAGFLWGMAAAIKLFPALLFIYLIKNKRMNAFNFMLASFLLLSFIPALLYGTELYQQYYSMLSRVLWYGDSWNASLYGYLFRLFIDNRNTMQSLFPIKLGFFLCFIILVCIYYQKLEPLLSVKTLKINHQGFCLTLIFMLLLSPFGWLYYFSLILFPLLLNLTTALQDKTKKQLYRWFLLLFLLNFPIDYVNAWDMSFMGRVGFYSFYFYGLLLLAYQTIRNRELVTQNFELKEFAFIEPIILSILSLGLFVFILSLLLRLL